MKIFSTFLVLSILISSCTWLKEHEYEGEDNNRRTLDFDREYRSRRTLDFDREYRSRRTLDFDREYRSRSTSQKYSNGAGAPESGMPSEPGKCYAKCLIQDLYELDSTYIYEYTGITPSEVSGVEYQTLKTAPASTKWVKKKADRNCISANPNDCLIWCLVDVDEQTESYYVVTDTTSVKEFTEVLIVEKFFVEAGGYTEWKEIICAADVTPRLYKNIQIALNNAGYDIKADGKVSEETKSALVRFQKDNGLPVGALDTDTLRLLEVR